MNGRETYEKPTSGSHGKKRGETHFRNNREDKRKNRLSESTVFFQSKRRPGRKEEKTEKRRSGGPLVNKGRNDHFQKDVKQRRAVRTVNFQSECVSAANRIYIKTGRFFPVVKIRPRPGLPECAVTLPFNYPRTLNPEGFREKNMVQKVLVVLQS